MTVGSTDTTFIFLLQMAQVNESEGAVANGSCDTDMARSLKLWGNGRRSGCRSGVDISGGFGGRPSIADNRARLAD
jgi:hypothetical protein